MNFLTFDVIKWGILIGSVIFVSIQLSAISIRLRNIDHAITVLAITKMYPELAELVKGDLGNE